MEAVKIKYVLDNQSKFQPSSNSENDTEYPKSWVLYQFPEFSEIILKYVRSLVPQVLRSLKMSPFEIAEIECQLTAHNDGNYYKVHNGNGSPDSATRANLCLTEKVYWWRIVVVRWSN